MKSTWRRYKRNESGQVAVFFALAAVPLFAVTSAAVDYSQITKEQNAITSALDAAVLAAANNNAIELDAKDEYAATHFKANYGGDLVLNLTSSVTSDTVRLVAEGRVTLTFGNIIGIKDPLVKEASTATLSTENTICVLALSEDASGAISFDSDLEFKANNCSVHSNSISGSAIIAERNLFTPRAKSFCAVGGVSGLVEPHSKGECSFVEDPYKDVEPATLSECKREFFLKSTAANSIGLQSSNYSNTGSDPAVNYSNLPTVNPVPFDDLLAELRTRHTKKNFGTNKGPKHERRDALQKVAELTGNDMRRLLAAYAPYGEKLRCKEDPKPECYGFDNPFEGVKNGDVPRRSVVADMFDISYGAYVVPDAVPDIVQTGVVELVDGILYSRNNIDNELIAVSDNVTGGNVLLTPGTYCGGLTVDGLRVRFAPGDYIFKDGPLTFLNNSEAMADRVTFGFTGSTATMNIESGSKLKIKAATEGPRKGLAFMQMIDASAPGNRGPSTGVNRIASGGSVSMTGTAYFPQQTLMISGEDSHIGASSPAVGLIANEIIFRGTRGSRVELAVDHAKAGIPPIEPRADDGVRLIE